MPRRLLVVVALVAAASACRELNDRYCAAHPMDQDCVAGPGPVGCQSNLDCSGEEPVCRLDRQVCVLCTADEHCATEIAAPRCDTDTNECVQCTVNSDCPSNACVDGACAAEGDVVYVGGTGASDAEDCSKARPCLTFQQALAVLSGRRFIKATGTITSAADIVIEGRILTIVGDAGTIVRRTNAGTAIDVRGMVTVALIGLDIQRADGNGGGVVFDGVAGARLAIKRTTVRNQRGSGIAQSEGTLEISDSRVSGNTAAGVAVTGGIVAIERSMIDGNQSTGIVASTRDQVRIQSSIIAQNVGATGGVIVSGSQDLAISNCIITANGTAFSGTGGLRLASAVGEVSFNTIAANSAAVLGGAAGVRCDAGAPAVANSILSDAVMDCTVSYSLGPSLGAGPGNQSGDPMFITVENPLDPQYYRISSTSAARDRADPEAALVLDIDAQPRAAPKDMGADEYLAGN